MATPIAGYSHSSIMNWLPNFPQECGPQGEPKVVHIDQECDYEITPLADNFEEFIRGLVNDDDFEFED